jgi:uncharacterized coiled-coil protein SlyX
MNIEERYEELVDRYACDDDSLLVLARMVAELEDYIAKREEYVNFLVKQLGDAQFDLMMAENR